jgi:hypothetical protein
MNAGQDNDGSENMAGQDGMSIGERLSAARKEHLLTAESVAE